MLVAPATGPRNMPARITSIGWSVIGTGVHGSGIAICEAAATAAAKPTTPKIVRPRERESEPALVRVVMSFHSRDAEGNRVAATEAQRREPSLLVSILERVQQCRQNTSAA